MFASCVSVRTTMRRDGQHAPATKLSSPPRPASFTTRTDLMMRVASNAERKLEQRATPQTVCELGAANNNGENCLPTSLRSGL
ncbi:hypothetical protein J6590_089313 [Homalodisca vitripennis]|nr:hypothetical protein J6590_089313 [Homalodisca vitripennis]